ncbi:hypothetical protein PROFUN_15136 [Planoprotostelium fungivorum]|uniref:Heme haloperoxidase family profile domain-containing protein n=1 Tax=Planoprotostelium fungivorum TaxID=1890364 RepID=A0A2P6MXV3_9EUKA|nr:hypothetical protein PROFUN_15136 [Planoprotostelium fungivorum]
MSSWKASIPYRPAHLLIEEDFGYSYVCISDFQGKRSWSVSPRTRESFFVWPPFTGQKPQMKTAFIFALLFLAAAAYPRKNGKIVFPAYDDDEHVWSAAGAGDVRSPCPALNTLANHNWLPHDGKNISKAALMSALTDGLNVGYDVALLLATGAFSDLGTPETITLEELQKHNMIEHDASLSRLDNYLGDSTKLDQTLFERLLNASSDGITISIPDFVKYRRERQEESKTNNPSEVFGKKQLIAAAGEVVLVSTIFGSYFSGLPVEAARTFFGSERFPDGWTKPAFPVFAAELIPQITRVAWQCS